MTGNRERLALALIVLSLPATTASGQEQHWPTDEEQARAGKSYQDCMYEKAKQIDDGKTDIGVVGLRVVMACKAEFDQMIDEIGRGLTPEERETFKQREEEMQRGFGAVAVGKVRIERRSSKP
jgi:hypothetical protein